MAQGGRIVYPNDAYCSDPLELDNYDSSSRISPRKGKHYVKASNVHTRVQGPGSTRSVDRHQGQGRDLSGVPAEATGFLPLAKGASPGSRFELRIAKKVSNLRGTVQR